MDHAFLADGFALHSEALRTKWSQSNRHAGDTFGFNQGFDQLAWPKSWSAR
jgi:hypothetical protein